MQTLTSIALQSLPELQPIMQQQPSQPNYANLTSTHIFVPFVIETSGASNAQAIELTQEIGRRTTAVTGDPRETNHLFQRLSIAIQQVNAVSFTCTFKSE